MKKLILFCGIVLMSALATAQTYHTKNDVKNDINLKIIPNSTRAITPDVMKKILLGLINFTVDTTYRSNDTMFFKRSTTMWYIKLPAGSGADSAIFSPNYRVDTMRTALYAAIGLKLAKASNLSDLVSAPTALTNLGGTTVGKNFFTTANPSAVTWPRVNADNTITYRSAANTLSDIGAQGAITFGTPAGVSPNGITFSFGSQINLTFATYLYPGIMSTASQTFTGVKYWNNDHYIATGNTVNGIRLGIGANSSSNSTVFGENALANAVTGEFSSNIFGHNAGASITTGSGNTIIGKYTTGPGITTGSNNTIIGNDIPGLTTTTSNNIVLGDGAGNIWLQKNSSGVGTVTGSRLNYAANYGTTSARTIIDAGAADSIANKKIHDSATTIIGHHITKAFNGAGDTLHLYADTTEATNTQTADYTLTLADQYNMEVVMTVGSANNLTVPTNASVAFPIGTVINISQGGAGKTTVVAAGGVTINSAGGLLSMRVIYSGGSLKKTGTNTWRLVGDLQ